MEKSQSVLSPHLQCFPPISLNHTSQFFKIQASMPDPYVQTRKPITFRTLPKPQTKKRRIFKEHDAFPQSLPLHSKNPRSVYKDIQTFARQNKLKEALTIMDYLEKQGIPVNATTFSALISACIRSKSLTEAKQIHAHVRIHGLENNEFLRTKLVQMYTSCGSLEDAQKVFDECTSSSTVYPWNALLRGTVLSGGKRYLDVLSTYSEMRRLGLQLNEYSFANVIKSFSGASALRQGLKTHALLIKNGFADSSMLRTSLIDLYFKCGKISNAYKVFEEMPERDIVVWGTMISGFSHNRLQREALDYIRWMVTEGIYPNSIILTTILPVIGEIWARKLGQEVHGYILKTKHYSKQLTIQSGLIDMYCKCGDMVSARQVFYSSRERNVVSWTALMSGYASNGRLEQALRSVAWMQQEGIKPDVVTVATVIPICAKLKALNRGKEIHAFAVKNWFFPNVSVTTSLMKMYSNCRVLDYSVKLFDTMENRNVISWTAMIDSYIENGFKSEALGVFRSMQMSKHRPDSVLMARMLALCGEIKALKLGREIHGHALKKRHECIPFVSAEIMKMYGSCGLIDSVKPVFDGIAVKGSVTWTAVIEAYKKSKQWRDAMQVFEEMIAGGYSPSYYTFGVVLSICDEAGFADEACRVFELMTGRYQVEATEEHYSIMIRLLNRAARVQEAERFRQMMSSVL